MIDDASACNPVSGVSHALPAQRGGHVELPKSGAPLGIVTKTSSTLTGQGLQPELESVYDVSTGEIKPVEAVRDNGIFVSKYKYSYDAKSARSKRFSLKSVVNDLMPGSRTSKCMRFRAPDSINGGLRPIEILKSSEHGKAFYQGLYACGSVWTCPVCAAKIAERRRVELKEALESAKKKGLKAHFITLTIPHGVGDDIEDLLAKLRLATKKMSSGRNAVKSRFQSIFESTGESEAATIGFIRALEVTHGKNGYHPHYHIILFTNDSINTSIVQYVYSKAWKKACFDSGLPNPSDDHGCLVKDGSYASDYISKWGIEDEMTKANTKITKLKGKSPWGLLDAVLQGNDPDYSPERAKSLFLVYSKAFSGQRQLYWSNGLRAALHISKEENDEVIVSKPDDVRSYLLAQIPFEQWKLVLKFKQEANLLSIAESNAVALQLFLKNLSLSNDEESRKLSSDEEVLRE
jgi:hypothetical protein